MRAKVLLEENEDGGFEHEGVIDCDHADVGHAIPAGTAAASDGTVHDVVGDEKECLKQLNHPAQGGSFEKGLGV